jgi:cytosine/adenosine deaminase-related metal-dependent hydrolase
MALPGPAPVDFPEILSKLWWRLDKALTLEDVRLSSQVMLLDAIRNGVTSLVDHHASPNAIEGSLDVIAEAVEQAGVRAVLCYEVSDRDGLQKTRQGIAENVRFLKRTSQEAVAGGRVAGMFGLHASLTLSAETLEACRQAAPDQAGFHIHAAEHEIDQIDSLAKSGLRVIERLDRHGILGPASIAAHAVHVDDHEIDLLAQAGTWVTHQPRSNMHNGVGVARVEDMLERDVRVCLGTDGFASTLWEEAKVAYLLQKAWQRDPRRMSAPDVLKMAVFNNARLIEACFRGLPGLETSGEQVEDAEEYFRAAEYCRAEENFRDFRLGMLAVGARADLILVDVHPFTPLTAGNLPWHILFGFQEGMITTTLVNGRVIMRDRRILTMDEDEISAQARRHAPKVWARVSG